MRANEHRIEITNSQFYLTVKSEVSLLLRVSGQQLNGISSYSSLYPGVASLTSEITKRGTDVSSQLYKLNSFDVNSIGEENLLKDLGERWQRLEARFLFETLFQCRKVAVLQQQTIAERVARKFKRAGKKHVFVGKESLLNVTIEFRMSKFIPEFVQKRIERIGPPGIWRYWDRLIQISSVKNAWKMSSKFLTKPYITEHIFAIFIVLMGGLLVALATFLLEFML